MLRRTSIRLAAGSLTLVVTGMAAAPSFAASAEATGTGSAFQATIAGMSADSMSYSATNNGSGETTSGNNKPAVGVLGGQNTLKIGTLAQDATTTAKAGKISSAACSGIAGQGATVVAAGDGSCLSGGQGGLSLGAGSLDLQNATLLSDSQLTAMLPDAVKNQLGVGGIPGLSDFVTTLSTALKSGLATLGNPALTLNADTLQSSCTAQIGNANGTADLSDLSLSASFMGNDVDLLDVPVGNPVAPNTELASSAGFTKVFTDALSTGLATSLNGQGALLQPIVDTIKQSVIDAAVAQFGDQLDMGLKQLISAVANKQVRPNDDSIEVTALAVRLLPAAASTPIGFDPADFDIAKSTCSAGTYQVTPAVKTSSSPTPNRVAAVPVAVDSGLAGDQGSNPFLPVLGGLMLLGGAGVGVRRVLRSRG